MLPKVTNENVLNVIKSELKNATRLSSNILEDTRSAKFVFDNISKEKNDAIKGYIQTIKSDPYGFLLYSDKQVLKIYIFILKNSNLANLSNEDATNLTLLILTLLIFCFKFHV